MTDKNKRYYNFNSTRQPAAGVAHTGFLLRPVGSGVTAWRDELGDVLSIQKSGAGAAINLAENTVDFAYNSTYNANPALADLLYKNVQLNHDRDLTMNIYPHVHWFQAKNYTPNLLFEYRWQKLLQAYTSAWTKLIVTTLVATYTAGTIMQISETASGIAIPVGTAMSDVLQLRLYRDTANASTLFAGTCPYNTGGNASVKILSVDVHIVLDSIGSTLELTK